MVSLKVQDKGQRYFEEVIPMEQGSWSPYVTEYDPLKCGSIDGTDSIPHDHGVVRAMRAKYRPNKNVQGDPKCTIFVSRLNHLTSKDALSDSFSKYGKVKSCRVIRDLVTGASKCYGFVEYFEDRHAERARRNGNGRVVDDNEVFVEYEVERTLKGWIPRRFGGGLGGKKEAGQLRFGGRERPFRRPIQPIDVSQPHGDYKERKESYSHRRDRGHNGRDYNDGNRDRHTSRYDNRERSDSSRNVSRYSHESKYRNRYRSRSRERDSNDN